ncbi:UPF0235 protein [Thiohalobacter sp. COW1]|uniref:UPF0235 protein FOKN1_3023 n=1 Tax=Thiohalobacter thiocyanaticus TaxID=585455 RepID=A0A1Z4VUS9_9GAMM|nr:uncharacterized protein FOKN1_3023 [Thiohalobacter thiocyanaticus]BCO32670.1 UPF0235 protein [Thiohalobacter sp. COW1]
MPEVSTPAWYRWDGEDLILDLHVQPGARREELAGEHGGRLKVRIKAAPIEGKANRGLIRFLADLFGVAPRDIQLLRGETGRDKRLRIPRPARLPPEVTRP